MSSAAAGQRQQPFSLKLVVFLVVAGLIAFGALVLMIAYGDRIGTVSGSRAPALSVSATGYKALVTLAGHFRDTSEVDGTTGLDTDRLVVAMIDEHNRPEDVARLIQLRRNRPTLLILPKWLTMPDPNHLGWVRTIGPVAGEYAERLIARGIHVQVADNAPGNAAGRGALDGLSVPIPEAPQTIRGDNLTPLLTLPDGKVLIGVVGDQPLYIAADPDLFNNHGLKNRPQAAAALAILDRLNSEPSGALAFDLRVQGLVTDNSPSLLRTALEPPFLAMTLALLFAALLAGLHGAFRFGQARREERSIAFGKAALVENSAGLIRLAGRETRIGVAYADVIRLDAARISAAPSRLQGDALDDYLDRLNRSDGTSFRQLAAQLALARDRNQLMAAARALFSWKKGIIR